MRDKTIRSRRMGAALNGIASVGDFEPLPEIQTDWSGDYNVDVTGQWEGDSVYGNSGDVVQWDWAGNANVVQETSFQTPPLNPEAYGIDPSKVLKTAAGQLFKYVQSRGNNGQPVYTPVRVTQQSVAQRGNSMPLLLGAAALLFLALK